MIIEGGYYYFILIIFLLNVIAVHNFCGRFFNIKKLFINLKPL